MQNEEDFGKLKVKHTGEIEFDEKATEKIFDRDDQNFIRLGIDEKSRIIAFRLENQHFKNNNKVIKDPETNKSHANASEEIKEYGLKKDSKHKIKKLDEGKYIFEDENSLGGVI